MWTMVPGRYRSIEFGRDHFRAVPPPVPADDVKRWLALPSIKSTSIVNVRFGDRPIEPEPTEGNDVMFRLPTTTVATMLELSWSKQPTAAR